MSCGIPVTDVCDPTLLLTKEEWAAFEKKVRLPKHYIAVYDLRSSPITIKIAHQLQEITGYPTVNLCCNRESWINFNFWGLSPQEWIYCIHHADYVIPCSYHGLCFSLIFERPFLCIPDINSNGKPKEKDNRQLHLLSKTGLLGQYISTSTLNISDKNLDVDFSQARKSLEEYRRYSLNWLKDNL